MKILISGEGGQGVQVLAAILANTAYKQKYNISYIPHYGVEMRMGISFAYVQMQKDPLVYPKFSKANLLIVMGRRDLDIPQSFIEQNTKIINAIPLINELEKNHLAPLTLNMLVLGIIAKELNTTEFRLDVAKIKEEIKNRLAKKKNLADNLKAFVLGLELDPQKYNQPLNQIKKPQYFPLVAKDTKKEFVRYPNLCKGCGLCLEKCPQKALSWSEDKVNFISRPIPEVDLNKCISCGICEQICPDSAIKIVH